MFRIRFHGRGGQGIKTASRILGSALFRDEYEVQDAPRYGAERRGAPIFAYVRADERPIDERGVITDPDLVVVADDSLPGVTAAGVMEGVGPDTVLMIASMETAVTWRDRLRTEAVILVLPHQPSTDGEAFHSAGTACAGAAARLLGCITEQALSEAVELELSALSPEALGANIAEAVDGYRRMAPHAGTIRERAIPAVAKIEAPNWIDLPRENADISAPAIHAGMTSVEVRTGLWRTMRPVLDKAACNRCVWICGSYCPDRVISTDTGGYPQIDLEHCKGCLVCVVQCPKHALAPVSERYAAKGEAA